MHEGHHIASMTPMSANARSAFDLHVALLAVSQGLEHP
jgi:hypothetical protein